jgi:Flp pilus assembly protein CpaB
MKASTLFAITIAVLLALGVAVGAKLMGFFERGPKTEKPAEPDKILVAKQNLFEGITISPDMVTVRPLRLEEREHYQNNRSKYLPATVSAAAQRIPLHNIEADQPILKDDLQDLNFPEPLTGRLRQNMRAVNLSLPKQQAAGGLIVRGDTVDVLLTSRICVGADCTESITQSAFIARGLRVIAKRDILWTVLQAIPENKPVTFTLEANPYRAALIEFAQTKGTIALLPSPTATKATTPTDTSTPGGGASFAKFDSPEYREEDQRVDGILKGDLTVSEVDLERIFKLKPIPRVRTEPPHFVQHISGVKPNGTIAFSSDGQPLVLDSRTPRTSKSGGGPRPQVEGQNPLGYTFRRPDSPTGKGGPNDPDCPDCAKKAAGQ